MEIISKGSLPSEAVYRTACPKCKTEFRFKKSETRPSPDQRDAGQFYIECPLAGCGRTVWNDAFIAELRTLDIPNYYRDH